MCISSNYRHCKQCVYIHIHPCCSLALRHFVVCAELSVSRYDCIRSKSEYVTNLFKLFIGKSLVLGNIVAQRHPIANHNGPIKRRYSPPHYKLWAANARFSLGSRTSLPGNRRPLRGDNGRAVPSGDTVSRLAPLVRGRVQMWGTFKHRPGGSTVLTTVHLSWWCTGIVHRVLQHSKHYFAV